MTIKREEQDRPEIDSSDVTAGQRLPPVHPGEILRDKFLVPMDLNVNRLAQAINVSPTRLYNIINKKSRVTSDTALRLGYYFGKTPEFWINLQTRYDLNVAEHTSRRQIEREIESLSIKPSETDFIVNKCFDLSGIKVTIREHFQRHLRPRHFRRKVIPLKHIQGIAQAGPYTVLSSSVDEKALILAYKKKIVSVQPLPSKYNHAGGIDTLEVGGGWVIVVPVYQGDKGAILRYVLPQEMGNQAKLQYCSNDDITLPTKVYAAGIAENKNRVVIAAVINEERQQVQWRYRRGVRRRHRFWTQRQQVQFWTCAKLNGQGKYIELGKWDEGQVPKNERKEWRPDKKWGGYPNSISLINHCNKIYFVGLNGQDWGFGFDKDWVDIYSVNLNTSDDRKRLIKKFKKHVKCSSPGFDGPSFRWGGNARIQNGKVKVLAVGRNVHDNNLIKYDEFELDINSIK